MTTPDRNTEIVNEMVDRLRKLQGSGEYVPLARRVTAGPGLAGGGTLTGDITISATPELVSLLQAVADAGGADAMVTRAYVDDHIAPLARRDHIAARVIYRDFTVGDAPLTQVSAPALRVDEACTLARVSVSVGAPGTQPVTVTVDGTTITVPAGSSQSTQARTGAKRAGDTIRVVVAATDASGIVVSVRLEEPGVTS